MRSRETARPGGGSRGVEVLSSDSGLAEHTDGGRAGLVDDARKRCVRECGGSPGSAEDRDDGAECSDGHIGAGCSGDLRGSVPKGCNEFLGLRQGGREAEYGARKRRRMDGGFRRSSSSDATRRETLNHCADGAGQGVQAVAFCDALAGGARVHAGCRDGQPSVARSCRCWSAAGRERGEDGGVDGGERLCGGWHCGGARGRVVSWVATSRVSSDPGPTRVERFQRVGRWNCSMEGVFAAEAELEGPEEGCRSGGEAADGLRAVAAGACASMAGAGSGGEPGVEGGFEEPPRSGSGDGCSGVSPDNGWEGARGCGRSRGKRDRGRAVGAAGAVAPRREGRGDLSLSPIAIVERGEQVFGGCAGEQESRSGVRCGQIFGRGCGAFHVYDGLEEAASCLGYGAEPMGLKAEGIGGRSVLGASDGGTETHFAAGGWRPRGVASRRLPQPAVETVDLTLVFRWASEEARSCIGVLLSWSEFEERVIAPGELAKGLEVERCRDLRVGAARFREMRRLGYTRPMRRAPDWGVNSPLFFIPKNEEEDRMLVDARALNQRCRRPPRMKFSHIHHMLQVLTRPGVRCYVAYDFATWFIQFRVVPEVAKAFTVRARDGSWHRITGVPMGWSWAPVLAQTVAEVIAAESLRRLSEDGVGCFVYVDNVIFHVEGTECAAAARAVRLDVVFRSVCAEVGAVIKESASVLGSEVDWLGVMLRAGSRSVRFRTRFVEKIRVVAELVGSEERQALRVWWRAIALAVRALWVARAPLAVIRDALRYVARSSVLLWRGQAAWGKQAILWRSARLQLLRVFAWLGDGGWFRVWEAEPRVLAIGVSDAAGASSGCGGYMFRCGRKVVVVRLPRTASEHINVLEHRALEAGVSHALRLTEGSGRIVWGGDNHAANAWGRASWSPDWRRCALVGRRCEEMAARGVELEVVKVPGGDGNPADLLTRAVPESLWLADGVSWECEFLVSCDCEEICDHVTGTLREKLGMPDKPGLGDVRVA